MSFLFVTADFYQYQIILLLRFQAGGRAAFFRGDAGQPASEQTNVSRCSGSAWPETQTPRPPALPVTPALFVLSVTSSGRRERRSCDVGVIAFSCCWADAFPGLLRGPANFWWQSFYCFHFPLSMQSLTLSMRGPGGLGPPRCQMTEGATRERQHLREAKQGFGPIEFLISNTTKYLSDLPRLVLWVIKYFINSRIEMFS